MEKESRSRGACWTCRARRKKCDESRPICSLCLSLKIECYGYMEKPAWMDGGARERAELKSMVRKVARVIQHRKLNARRLSVPENPPPIHTPPYSPSNLDPFGDHTQDMMAMVGSSGLGGLLDSEAPLHRETAVVDNAGFLPEHFIFSGPVGEYTSDSSSHVSDTKHPENPSTVVATPSSPALPAIFSLEDSSLIIHYLEHLYPWQFRYQAFQESPFSKDWLLWFILHHRPLYLITCAMSASNKPRQSQQYIKANQAYEDDASKRSEQGIQELQSCLLQYQSGISTYEEPLHILLCIIMLLFQDILQGGSGTWPIHLQAALCILEPESGHHYNGEHQYAHGPLRDLNSFRLDSVMGRIMWFHILSGLSFPSGGMNISSKECENYTAILQPSPAGCRVDLESITGCPNWVATAIVAIYSLRDWKAQAELSGPLSVWKLSEKAGVIRRSLKAGLEDTLQAMDDHASMELLLQSGDLDDSSQYEKRLLAVVFARAALVLLNVVVSGAHPALGEIEQEVVAIIGTLKNLPDPSILRFLTWPICIAGCMALEQYHAFFTSLQQQFETPALGNVIKVIRRCWSLRELNTSQRGIDWSDALNSLQLNILFL